jgi:isovaleryl-CoA dehydrogenase
VRGAAFLIEKKKGMPGFRVKKLDKLGMRGSHTGVVQQRQCRRKTSWAKLEQLAPKVLMKRAGHTSARIQQPGPIGIMQSVMDGVVPYIHDHNSLADEFN